MSRCGMLALVLHAHLPFVRHPEHPHHLEEHWLFEAITDSYLPLLRVLFAAAERGTLFRCTVSLSPTLLSMLADPLLRARYLDYLGRRERLCEDEISRYPPKSPLGELARYYLTRLVDLRDFYSEALGGDLIAAWTRLRDLETVELMTTAATHGYLPLLRSHGPAVRAQIRVARRTFEALTKRRTRGFWLPECGYYPGLENEIAASGFRFAVLDAHGLEQGTPSPPLGVYAPVRVNGVALFGRDPYSAREVWDRTNGYPGHPLYREYHRDLGFEGHTDALSAFLPAGVAAAPTGIKYFRVTGPTARKALYRPDAAMRQAEHDAHRFVLNRRRLLATLRGAARPPIVVAPYDAELFGHWWYEGPAFLDALVRKLDTMGEELKTVTLSGYLRSHGTAGECQPASSSWGERGYNEAWLRPETGWVHLHLHQLAIEFSDLIRARGPGREPLRRRLLLQAGRSLLLAQSSDWTFHMGRSGGGDYAEARLRDQLARFDFLIGALRAGTEPGRRLAALENMDNLFPNMKLRDFL